MFEGDVGINGGFLSDTIETRLRKFRKIPHIYCERTISKSSDFIKRGYSLLSLVNHVYKIKCTHLQPTNIS